MSYFRQRKRAADALTNRKVKFSVCHSCARTGRVWLPAKLCEKCLRAEMLRIVEPSPKDGSERSAFGLLERAIEQGDLFNAEAVRSGGAK